MASSCVRTVAFALVLLSGIGVWAQLHDIISEGGGHWDYSDGPYGPANWYKLDPEYRPCAGKLQSPLNVFPQDMVTDPQLGQVNAKYNLNRNPATISKTDHDIKVQMPKGSGYLTIGDGEEYALDSFHYHMPSEHRIMNQTFPLELHVVHWTYVGRSLIKRFAVVSYLFVLGDESKFLNQLRPDTLASLVPNKEYTLGPIQFMPLLKSYGRYKGSLTVPPCTERVTWTINLWNFPTVSSRQLKLLSDALPTKGHINNRPTFPSTDRGFRMSF